MADWVEDLRENFEARQSYSGFRIPIAHNKICEPRKRARQRRTTTPSHARPACDGDPGSVLRLYALVRAIWDTPFQELL